MSRLLALAVPMVVAGLATPAFADWRDFMGKTLILETQTSGQTENDVITARGGASDRDEISKNDCAYTYHLYVSLRGRLFMHTSRSKCAGSDAYTSDQAYGTVFDLKVADGMSEATSGSPPLPYSLSETGDELVIEQPQTGYSFGGDGYVSTISNPSGHFKTRIRFAADCSMELDGEASYRYEFKSTDSSEYYVLQDVHFTYGLKTLSCRVTDGFQLN